MTNLKHKFHSISKSKAYKIFATIWVILSSILLLWVIVFFIYEYCPKDFGTYGIVKEHQRAFKGNHYLYNTETGEIVADNLDWVRWNGDSIAVVSADGKRAYLNINEGRLLMQPTFEKAWQFHEGIAAVQINDRIRFINTKGEFVFNGSFPIPSERVSDKMFYDGLCIMPNDDGSIGIINKQGEWELSPKYEFVQRDNNGWYRAFKNGVTTLLTPNLDPTVSNTQVVISQDTILVYKDTIPTIYIREL